MLIGTTSVKENFGSASTGANNYCEAQRAVNFVADNGEVFPARFNVLAW